MKQLRKKKGQATTVTRVGAVYVCSFCGKSNTDVRMLVKSSAALICDECIDVCVGILEEKGIAIQRSRDLDEIDVSTFGIKPHFRTLKFQVRMNHCFHLCPFSDPFNAIYSDHVCKSASTAGFTIDRADEIFGTEPIIDDIWQAINSSAVVIADVTGKNPNVMYEIGMAHTVGRPVIIMAQSMDDVPFDLKHYRCIIYEYTLRGCVDLEERLAGTLRFLKGKKTSG